MSVDLRPDEPILIYDSLEQRDILLRARSLVDSYRPHDLVEFARSHPGFDFGHPVAMETVRDSHDIDIPIKSFETLAYRCIRVASGHHDAGADAPWIASGFETFKTLLDMGVDPAVRNGQGFSCLDLAGILLGKHRWRLVHNQADAFESMLKDCLVHMVETGIDIQSPSRTTTLGRYLTDHETPKKMLEAIVDDEEATMTGKSTQKTRAVAQAILMKVGVDPAHRKPLPGTRF